LSTSKEYKVKVKIDQSNKKLKSFLISNIALQFVFFSDKIQKKQDLRLKFIDFKFFFKKKNILKDEAINKIKKA
jgi:hypothetical protein